MIEATKEERKRWKSYHPFDKDKVNSPWDSAPDLEELNEEAYEIICDEIDSLQEDPDRDSRGILVLGEAGMGKSHLLSRFAHKLTGHNHILYATKPTNTSALEQSLWSQILDSLCKPVINEGVGGTSQLDDLLCHVLANMLIPIFRKRGANLQNQDSTQAANYRLWADSLTQEPLKLINLTKNVINGTIIYEAILKYFTDQSYATKTCPGDLWVQKHCNIDIQVFKGLLKLFFFKNCNKIKESNLVLRWLKGEILGDSVAEEIGLKNWFNLNDESAIQAAFDGAIAQKCIEAVKTIGTLSLYYQPLVLAFDQMEGFKFYPEAFSRFCIMMVDLLQETPNLLIMSFYFESMWKNYVLKDPALGGFATKLSSSEITLDPLDFESAESLLSLRLNEALKEENIDESTYPFEKEDIKRMIQKSKGNPRLFIHHAKAELQKWRLNMASQVNTSSSKQENTQELNELLQEAFTAFWREQEKKFDPESVENAGTTFDCIKECVERLIDAKNGKTTSLKSLTYKKRVIAPNIELPSGEIIAVLDSSGRSFFCRLANFIESLETSNTSPAVSSLIRDRRLKVSGAQSNKALARYKVIGGRYVTAKKKDVCTILAAYAFIQEAINNNLVLDAAEPKPVSLQDVCTALPLFKQVKDSLLRQLILSKTQNHK